MSPIEPTLRELRRERARNEITAAAIELFTGQGYDATTVDQIAQAALISPRTFYNYFPSKEDVLFYEADAGTEAFRFQVTSETPVVGPFEAVRAACLSVARLLDSSAKVDLPRFKIIAAVPALQARDRSSDRALLDAISAAVATEHRRSRAGRRRARLVAAATLGGLNEAVDLWVAGDGQPPLASIVTELFDSVQPLYAPPPR